MFLSVKIYVRGRAHKTPLTTFMLGTNSPPINSPMMAREGGDWLERSASTTCILLYCIVSMRLYSASCSALTSEALPVRGTQREESSLERTKRGIRERPMYRYCGYKKYKLVIA